MTVLSLLSAVWAHWKRINCHVRKCPRIGRYPVADSSFKVCWKHHPDPQVRRGGVTADYVHRVHHTVRDRQ